MDSSSASPATRHDAVGHHLVARLQLDESSGTTSSGGDVCSALSRRTRARGATSRARRSSLRFALSSCQIPISVLIAITPAKMASFQAPGGGDQDQEPERDPVHEREDVLADDPPHRARAGVRLAGAEPRGALGRLRRAEAARVVGRHAAHATRGGRLSPTMPPMLPPLAERRPDLAVAPADLRLTIGADAFPFATTAELETPRTLLGQRRAVAALELGLSMRTPGSHVFAAGYPGTGRKTAINEVLGRIAARLPVPPDRAYVNRFSAPDRPRLLTLPPGAGAVLAREVDEMRRNLLHRLPQLLDSEQLSRQRDELGKRFAAEEEREVGDLQRAPRRTASRSSRSAPDRSPTPRSCSSRTASRCRSSSSGRGCPRPTSPPRRSGSRRSPTSCGSSAARRASASASSRRRSATRGRLRTLAEEEIADVIRHVPDPSVQPFLDEVRDDVVDAVVGALDAGPEAAGRLEARLERYRVNVIADRSSGRRADRDGAVPGPADADRLDRPRPGRAAHVPLRRDHDPRRHAAAGGRRVPVVHAVELVAQPGAWVALKRTLETGQLEIGAAAAGLLGIPRPLEPDVIPVDVKVVMVGSASTSTRSGMPMRTSARCSASGPTSRPTCRWARAR